MTTEAASVRVRGIAEEIRPWDPHAAERLDSLAGGLESEERDPWVGLDLAREVDVDAIVDRAINRDSRPHRTSVLERIRNVLVLVPIFVTWAGLSWAATSYSMAIAASPALAGQPFLLLWEQGFDGLGLWGPGFRAPLSVVAAVDAAVVLLIAVLTWVVHSQTLVAAAEHHAKTQSLEDRLRDAMWFAGLELRRRGSLSGAIDQFGRTASGLTDQLRAEREHLKELVNTRERAMGSIRDFAREFGTAAAALSTSTHDMAAKVTGATRASAELADSVGSLQQTQVDLVARLGELTDALAESSASARQVAGATEAAAGTLSEAAETITPATARMADGTGTLRQEIAALRQDLESGAATRRVADEELTKRLQSAADSLVRSVDEVGTSLKQLSFELEALRNSQAYAGAAAKAGDRQ